MVRRRECLRAVRSVVVMRFGLHFQVPCAPHQSPRQRLRDTIEQAAVGEALGFDSGCPVEQHFDASASMLSAPLLVLAAIAEHTTTMRLGTAVTLAPLAHPIRLAEELATLDLLSDGRVECGLGRGMDASHFAGYGVEQAVSTDHEQLVETIDVLHKAWTGVPVTLDGPRHHLSATTVVPRPLAGPPPIRLAANSADTFALAGRLGMPILVATHVNPPSRLVELLELYRSAKAEHGWTRNADDVTILVPTFTHDDVGVIRATIEPGVDRLASVMQRKLQTWIDMV